MANLKLTIWIVVIALIWFCLLNTNTVQGFSNTYQKMYNERSKGSEISRSEELFTHYLVCLPVKDYRNRTNRIPFCDGTIIGRRWVLTYINPCIYYYGYLLIENNDMVVRSYTTHCLDNNAIGTDYVIQDYIIAPWVNKTYLSGPALIKTKDYLYNEPAVPIAPTALSKDILPKGMNYSYVQVAGWYYGGLRTGTRALRSNLYCNWFYGNKLRNLYGNDYSSHIILCIENPDPTTKLLIPCSNPGSAVMAGPTLKQIGIIMSLIPLTNEKELCVVYPLAKSDIDFIKRKLRKL